MKKIISFILVFIIASGVWFVDPMESQAKITVDNFNLDIYRANEYLKKKSVCNNIITNLLKDDNLPAQVIVKELDSKKFGRTVAAWELSHLADKSPYEIVQGEMDKKGYYEAILLSIFISESKLNNSLLDMGKTVSTETNQVLASVKSWIEKSDEIGINASIGNQKINKLTTKQNAELKKYISSVFKKQHPLLDKSGKITEVFNDVFTSVDTVYDAINKMAYYTKACEISNQSKNLIHLMYEDCSKSNPAMKEALRELEVSLDGFNQGVEAELQSVAIKQSSEVLAALSDAGWEKVIYDNPYSAAFFSGAKIGTKIGDNICNTFFSTDKTIEQYEKMKCLGEFYDLLGSSAQKLGNTYLKKKTAENAQNYFAAIDALFSTVRLSCKFGMEYAEVLYKDATLGWMSISDKSYSRFISDIKSIQKSYTSEQKSLVNNYLVNLKAEFPIIYKTLILGQNEKNTASKKNEKPISVKDQKTWGKAYIKAMNDWEIQVKKWAKDANVKMPKNSKEQARAALIHITNGKIPQMIYYYASSIGVFQYVNGRVFSWGRVSFREGDILDFYYAENKERGYLSTFSSFGEQRSLYSFTKYGPSIIFDGAEYKLTCYVYPSPTQKKVESLTAKEYHKRFNKFAGNVKFEKASDKAISAKIMQKKLGGK